MDEEELRAPVAAFELADARRRALRAIAIMRDYLSSAEEDLARGGAASHPARAMARHLAELAEAGGEIRVRSESR